jgi:hypothetical protein
LDRIPILTGRARALWWVADTSGKFRAKVYYDKLNKGEKAKFDAMFEQVGGAGAIVNTTRYRKEGPHLYAFKSGKHRLLTFHHARDVMVAHGIKKKNDTDKRHTRALELTARMCAEYRDENEPGDDHGA